VHDVNAVYFYFVIIPLLAATFVVSLITHRRQKATARAMANVEFRNLTRDSNNPRYSFCGSTATVLHDEESWARYSKFEPIRYFLTRYARNDHGEYFVFMTQGGRGNPSVLKHLDPEYARSVLAAVGAEDPSNLEVATDQRSTFGKAVPPNNRIERAHEP